MDEIQLGYMKLLESFFFEGDYSLNNAAQGMILKTIRKIFDLNQGELAELIDITSSYVSAMENGKKKITFNSKLKIANALLLHSDTTIGSGSRGAIGKVIDLTMEKIMNNVSDTSLLEDMQLILQNPQIFASKIDEEKAEWYKSVYWDAIEPNLIDEIRDVDYDELDRHNYENHSKLINKIHYATKKIPTRLSQPEMESRRKRETLINNLKMVLDENDNHQDELLDVLHKSLADISSFFSDIDIIRKYDLETTLDRISRSIKRLLRDSYNNIHKDVQVLGYVGAGIAYDYVETRDMISLPESEKADYALIIRGDSMSPSYQDGDFVFVKEQPTLENGEYGIIEIDGKYLFKRFCVEKDKIVLKSINRNYQDIVLPKDSKPESFSIKGKVIIGSK